jgi:cytochrome c oxidase subunit 2
LSFIHSKQRIWLDLLVGVVLLSMLGFGSVSIYRLNNDARQVSINNELAMRGQQLSTDHGCIACHTVDGSKGVGPSWLGMWGRTSTLGNGGQVLVDEAYFRESLMYPYNDVVEGYPNVMLRYFLEEPDINALVAFAQSLAVSKGSE